MYSPQIEDFTWSRHLFNLKGKIRKPSIKNTSVVLMYMIIYIKFCNKNLQCFFCSRYNLRKVNYIALFPSYILKKCKIVNTRAQSRILDLGLEARWEENKHPSRLVKPVSQVKVANVMSCQTNTWNMSYKHVTCRNCKQICVRGI